MSTQRTPKHYKDAGVDIQAGERLVEAIKPAVARTHRPEVLGGLGGFGGLFALQGDYREPVLVSGTDGVGTKLLLAQRTGLHQGLGIDLVAMCVNDILVSGAQPLFFLDYYATGELDPKAAAGIIEGIAEGCVQAGAALLGGETAEMPGCYAEGHYDLAGFAVGVVERKCLIDGSACAAGDVVLGLASSGAHSNGYSLLRQLLEQSKLNLMEPLPGSGDETAASVLMRPTLIYVRAIQALLKNLKLHALAHITGGGLPGNLPRSLPAGLKAVLDPSRWDRDPLFEWVLKEGVPEDEAFRTFNMGLGFCVVLDPNDRDQALQLLAAQGIQASEVGRLEPCQGDAKVELVTGSLE